MFRLIFTGISLKNRMGSWCPIDFILVVIVRWITKMCDHFLPTKLAFLDSRETWPGGLVGGRMDNDKKVTSFFFIYKYIKYFSHIFILIYIKKHSSFVVGLKFWTS